MCSIVSCGERERIDRFSDLQVKSNSQCLSPFVHSISQLRSSEFTMRLPVRAPSLILALLFSLIWGRGSGVIVAAEPVLTDSSAIFEETDGQTESHIVPLFSDQSSAQSQAEPATGIQQVQYPYLESGAQNIDPAMTPLGPKSIADTMSRGETSRGDPDQCDDPMLEYDPWRDGITSLTYTLIPASREEVSWSSFDLRHAFEVPRYPGVKITPRFSWHLVDRAPFTQFAPYSFNFTDISPELYDFAVDASLSLPIGDRWEIQGSIAPGMYTDFYNVSSEAFRLPFMAAAFYRWSPSVAFGAGVMYLDREDIIAAAILGVVLGQPEDNLRMELFFPRSKIGYRFKTTGEVEHWFYLAQDYIGGGSWAMEHAYGLKDVVSYRDQKLMLGYERMVTGERAAFIEAGYVYDRELQFKQLGYGKLSSTGVLRMGFIF